MSSPPSLSTLTLPPDLDADDVIGFHDQLAARVASIRPPPKGKKPSDKAALPAGVPHLDELPPHLALPLQRFESAVKALQAFRRARAAAAADQAHAAADETEQSAANADADDRWRAFEQWASGAAGLADDGKAPSPVEARWLYAQLFPAPDGLRFITRRPRAQWSAMEQRMKVLEGERAQAVITGFGGTRHQAQLAAAHTRFGKAFGFTAARMEAEGSPTDGRPQWVAARDALRTLVQKIEGHADPDIDGSEALADYLLGPYVEMASDLEKSRRDRARKAEATPAASIDKPGTP